MKNLHTDRGGFTLIEILISMVLLSLVAVGLATGLMVTSQQSRVSKVTAARNAVMSAEVSRLSAMPTNELVAGTTSQVAIRSGLTFTRTTTISTNTDSVRAQVVVAPPVGRGSRADTVVITRTMKAGSANPFSP